MPVCGCAFVCVCFGSWALAGSFVYVVARRRRRVMCVGGCCGCVYACVYGRTVALAVVNGSEYVVDGRQRMRFCVFFLCGGLCVAVRMYLCLCLGVCECMLAVCLYASMRVCVYVPVCG